MTIELLHWTLQSTLTSAEERLLSSKSQSRVDLHEERKSEVDLDECLMDRNRSRADQILKWLQDSALCVADVDVCSSSASHLARPDSLTV